MRFSGSGSTVFSFFLIFFPIWWFGIDCLALNVDWNYVNKKEIDFMGLVLSSQILEFCRYFLVFFLLLSKQNYSMQFCQFYLNSIIVNQYNSIFFFFFLRESFFVYPQNILIYTQNIMVLFKKNMNMVFLFFYYI